MPSTLIRVVSTTLLVLGLAACAGAPTPAPSAPTTDVNPVNGNRGGSGAH